MFFIILFFLCIGMVELDFLVFFVFVKFKYGLASFFFLLLDILDDVLFFFLLMVVRVVVNDGDIFFVFVLTRDVFFLKFGLVLGFLNFFIGDGLVFVDFLFDWFD